MRGEYRVYGLRSSYFTEKLLSGLAAKQLPHSFVRKTPSNRLELETRAGTHRIPLLRFPSGWIVDDAWAILQHLERLHPDPALLPATPVRRIVCRVLEDWIDEWLIRPALHMRWTNDVDAFEASHRIADEILAGSALPRDSDDGEPFAVRQTEVAMQLRTWGLAQAEQLGAAERGRGELQLEYARLLELLGRHLGRTEFLLGAEPTLADLTLRALMRTHFAADPSPREILAQRAPALLRRVEGDEAVWGRLTPSARDDDAIPIGLLPILEEAARSYHPFLRENHRALKAGASEVHFEGASGPQSMVVRRYAERRRVALGDAIAAESATDRHLIRQILDPLGAWSVYQLPPHPGSG